MIVEPSSNSLYSMRVKTKKIKSLLTQNEFSTTLEIYFLNVRPANLTIKKNIISFSHITLYVTERHWLNSNVCLHRFVWFWPPWKVTYRNTSLSEHMGQRLCFSTWIHVKPTYVIGTCRGFMFHNQTVVVWIKNIYLLSGIITLTRVLGTDSFVISGIRLK